MALRFLDAIEASFRMIQQHPEIGSPRYARTPRLAGLRKWAIRGFEKNLIFYPETGSTIDVIRVLHSARDIPAALDAAAN